MPQHRRGGGLRERTPGESSTSGNGSSKSNRPPSPDSSMLPSVDGGREDMGDEPPKKVPLSKIFRYYTYQEKMFLLLGGVFAFLHGGCTPVFMFLFGRMATAIFNATSTKDVTKNFALVMICIGTFVFTLAFIHNSIYLVMASRQTGRLKSAYFAAVLGQNIGWHDEHKPGELVARLQGDARVVQNGLNDRLSGGFKNVGLALFGFSFALLSSWQNTLVIIGAMPLVGILLAVLCIAIIRYVAEAREEYAVAGAIATEVFENIRTVQCFNREGFEADHFAVTLLHSRATSIRKEFLMAITSGASLGLMLFIFAGAFIFSAYLVATRKADVGDISASFFSVLYGSNGLGLILPSVLGLAESCTTAAPLFATIDRMPAIDIDEPLLRARFHETIEFKDVDFSYPTRPDEPIFQSMSFTIRKGEKVAFSGSSGCGKSTIVSLIQRFYDPVEGSILIDGTDLRDVTLHHWRSLISIVSQEPRLFTGTVMENIRIGKWDATDEEVVHACKMARIHDTIMSLPSGYDSYVGAVGSQLSGGQKQRLAIARAIVRRPLILLLDEATSALDRKSEVEVQGALDYLMQHTDMTVVTIAHRLATIKNVDRIFFLDTSPDGSYIAEVGTFQELLRLDGRFAAIATMQGATWDDSVSVVKSAKVSTNKVPPSPNSPFMQSFLSGIMFPSSFPVSPIKSPHVYDSTHSSDNDTNSLSTVNSRVPFNQLAEWERNNVDVSMWRIIRMTKGRSWAIVLGSLGSILSALSIPLCALLFSRAIVIFGNFEANQSEPQLRQDMKMFVPLFFGLGVMSFIGFALTGFYGYVGEYLTYDLRTGLFTQVLRQDATFFDCPGRSAAALSSILSGDCEAVHQLYGPAIGSRLKSLFAFLGSLVIGLIMQWKVALVSLSTIPLLVGGLVLQQVFSGDTILNRQDVDINTLVNESFSAIHTVHSFNMKGRAIRQYKRFINAEQGSTERRCVLISVVVGFTELVSYGTVGLAFWYGGTLVDKGEADFGNVLMASMTIMMGASFAGAEAGGFATKMHAAQKSARSVFAIIDRIPDVDTYEYGYTDIGNGCDILFDNVEFRYPSREAIPVLHKFNLHLHDGTSNGLMGQTGCGKSTVVQLLARFYEPSAGQIFINGNDLTTLDTVTWRNNISVVLQEPSLFSGTISDNIKYGVPDATDEEVQAAAELACIHDDIMAMEDGYDTEVGYRGQELSGGQKQRVAIARGVLRCPRLLLLDEATSALDNATEAAVQKNLDEFQRRFGITTISIAHKLMTIRYCDQIVLVDMGRVTEHGTHDQLMALNGEYKSRWEMMRR